MASSAPPVTPRTEHWDPSMTPHDTEAPDSITIGRDPRSTICMDAPSVSATHARIEWTPPGRLMITDLSSTNGTYVNGQAITSCEIQLTDDVRVGSVVIRLWDPRIARLLIRIHNQGNIGEELLLGSGSGCAIQLAHHSVAPIHAACTRLADGAFGITAHSGDAGTYVDHLGNAIQQARVHPRHILILGQFALPLQLLNRMLRGLSGLAYRGAQAIQLNEAMAAAQLSGQAITVGRGADVELKVDHPTVSDRHVRLTRLANGTTRVEDLGSSNGTYVNGRRVTTATAEPGDTISVGAVSLRVGDAGVIAGAEQTHVRMDTTSLSYTVKDRSTGAPRKLLDDVSFSVYDDELVGILGPSGAGKTTLLLMFLGLERPTEGQVLLNGQPLLQNYEAFCTNVGYVPQDDIVHPELTVREALYYACKLRLPKGTKRAYIDQATERTLKQVGLWEQRDLQIGSPEEKVLSGGQRRRVNLAVELVTNPALLILDEPTSGLSWSDAADVVARLRELADLGRTVILTIHQPDYQEYEKFDNVAIMGRGGKLLFYGPPTPDSYTCFGAEPGKPRQIFDHIDQAEPDHWRARFQSTDTHARFVAQRNPAIDTEPQPPPPEPRKRSSLRQLPILFGRSLKLTLRHKAALFLLLMQAPLLGLLIGTALENERGYRQPVFGCIDDPDVDDTCLDADDLLACDPRVRSRAQREEVMEGGTIDENPPRISDPRVALIAILMALFLPMVIVSANSLVAERTVYLRERLAGLRLSPYVLSRFLVLSILGALVAALHLAVVIPYLDLQAEYLDYLAVGVLTTSCAVAIGLALSASVQSPVSALWGITALVIPQLIFAGSIVKLQGITEHLSWGITTRYGLEALTHLELGARALEACQVERFMTNLPGFHSELGSPLLFAGAGIGGITLLCLLATVLILQVRDRR